METTCLDVNIYPSLRLCMVMICCPPTEETPATPFWISLTLFACPLCYISPAIKIPRSSSPVIPKIYHETLLEGLTIQILDVWGQTHLMDPLSP